MASNSEGTSVDPPRKEDSCHDARQRSVQYTEKEMALNFTANHVNAIGQQISNNEEKISLGKININSSRKDKENQAATTLYPANQRAKAPLIIPQGKNDPRKNFQGKEKIPLSELTSETKSVKDPEVSQHRSVSSQCAHQGIPSPASVYGPQRYRNERDEVRVSHEVSGRMSHERSAPVGADIPHENYQCDTTIPKSPRINGHVGPERFQSPTVNSHVHQNDNHEPTVQHQSQRSHPEDFLRQAYRDDPGRNITFNFGDINTSTFTAYHEH